MKLHWSPRSPYVRKVMIAAHELGLADRIETVRTLVSMTTVNHALLSDNPLGKIPTLVLDDGTALYDSLTICEYLDHLAAPRLFPLPGPARWTVLTWHALGHGLLDTLLLWRNVQLEPEAQRSPKWLAAFAAKTPAALDRMQALVPGLDAAPFGIGHIAIGVALSYLDFRFADLDWRAGRPTLAAWHHSFEARPAVLAVPVLDD